ncbi:hypothetical protein Q9L58_010150 [Maublancomyces gigas]|uniref:Uncharacterized protein n=1 Tax=Discina gigas TaxID=1032678 RepID=A0ABR3G4X4_9PEZI
MALMKMSKNKTQSGERVYQKLCDWLSKHKYLRQLRRTWVNRRGEDTEASSTIGTAFQALIVDVGAKERKSAGASDRQFRVRVADKTDDEDDHEDDEAASGADVPFGNPAHIQLTDAEEVEALVTSSNARQLRAQVVLHRALGGDQTPPPDCFAYIEDEDYTIIDMPAEDSDHDENMIIEKVVIRRDRQSEALARHSAAYRKRFPDAIVPGDPRWSRDHIGTAEERASLDNDPETDDDGSKDVQDDDDDVHGGDSGDGAGTGEGAEGVAGGTGAVVGDAEGIVGGAEGAAGGAEGVAGGAETGGGGGEGNGAGTALGSITGRVILAHDHDDSRPLEEELLDA